LWQTKKVIFPFFVEFLSNKLKLNIGKTQPLILPLFDILKKGKTNKNFDTSRRCKINFSNNQMSNFLDISSRGIEHFSGFLKPSLIKLKKIFKIVILSLEMNISSYQEQAVPLRIF